LRTLSVTGQCPECGHFVAQTASGYVAALDDQGHVASDLPCVGCGYNLRTQPATGLCPECGAPVAPSTLGHYLHLAAPQWVRRLANGALLLVITLCTVGGASVLAVVVAFIVAAIAPSPGDALALVLPALAIAVGVVGLWLTIRGLVSLTAPEPTTRFRPEGFTARKLVRYGLLALPIAILAGIGLAVLQTRASPFGFAFSTVTVLPSTLTAVVQIVLVLITLRHIMTLMRRVPRRGLVVFAKIEFWGLLISGIVYIASWALFLTAATWMFTPPALGPNAPAPPYALGPNAPAVTSAPALGSLGYAMPGTVTVTRVGPGGITTTTTMPASAPMALGPLPTFSPLFFVAPLISMAGGCSLLGFGIAGLVLLILVWRALANTAQLAEAHTANHPTPSQPPQPGL
jgi:hypothetical protein